ncbi:MAG TPA: ABC transporter permease [Selenomonadales bacterium]|nr:ABC transporter permease [Selenomonadales bacterium]
MLKMTTTKVLRGLYLPAVIILVWIAGSWLAAWNSYIIPPPGEVLAALTKLLADGVLAKHVLVSLYRVFAGFLAAFLLAFPLGVAVGMSSRCNDYLQPTLEFIRHVPPLAAMPMLILWFGIGEWPKLLIVILATFFPIFLNTLHGVASCDVKLVEVGKSFGLSKGETFRRIVFPAALPSVLVGMRLGLGYSWRALVGAELIAASSGIGYMILDAEQLARPDVVVLGILTIGVLGSLIDGLFLRLTKLAIPWKESEEADYGRG